MPRKKKSKKQEPEDIRYELKIMDYEPYYHFGINEVPQDLLPGAYLEICSLTLNCKILLPDLEKANQAQVKLSEEPKLDDFWTDQPTIISAKAVGWMEIPRGDDTLIFYCSIPSRAFAFVYWSINSGKTKYAALYGTKLKWRRGTVSSFSFSVEKEDEE